MNDSSFVEEPVESQEMPQQRRIFLITYSQADLNKFENCLSFSEAVVDAFGAQHIKEWACCMEPHQDGGYHYHMALSLKSSRRWGPVKRKFLQSFNVSLHFKIRNCGYVAAYRYVCKDKDITDVLHSPGHSNMAVLKSPKTKKAMRQWSNASQQKKRNSVDENESTAPPRKIVKHPRLSNLDVSKLLINDTITSENELMRLALRRSQNGENDLQAFLLNKTPKAIADLITTTWKIHNSEKTVEREQKSRIDLIKEFAAGECVSQCVDKEWLRCAREILSNNRMNVYYYACAIRNSLRKGRSKGNNILIVGPTNCGKSFLLNPLELIFKTFINPANTRYAWIDLEGCEVAYLNDFRWNREIIEWSDFLLLLEGQTVHLPRPKNQFSSDLLVDRNNTIPFFATSKGAIEYLGKYNVRDDKECDMMASRWLMFTFGFQVENPKSIEPCPRCFSELILSGVMPDEED